MNDDDDAVGTIAMMVTHTHTSRSTGTDLISDKDFTEKQVGLLFLVFGLSQFLCMTPAGYFLDYSNQKIDWVIYSAILISAITVFGTLTAEAGGQNMTYLVLCRVIQGGLTAILPPGFNGITLGIVGRKGFTYQVSRNRMMTHLGTALVVAAGSLLAYYYYPNLEYLFSVSPVAAAGVCYFLSRIKPDHVHRDAARALILESPTMTEYELADDLAACKQEAANILQWDSNRSPMVTDTPMNDFHRFPSSSSSSNYQPPELSDGLEPPATTNSHQDRQPSPEPPLLSPTLVDPRATQRFINPVSHQSSYHATGLRQSESKETQSDDSVPSFNLGWSPQDTVADGSRPRTPWAVLVKPDLGIFVTVLFLFHLANSSVLPLVMQSLALQDAQFGILLSGLCIFIAQGFMAFFARLCGDFSPYWGRKTLILVGLMSLTIRCFLLSLLESAKDTVQTEQGSYILRISFLTTQLLDSVGAGIMGTMQILVTNDISGGTGRFSLLLGVTTGAMCLGATVSGYLGQALAADYGYPYAFTALGAISLLPFTLYAFCMPETLPEDARPRPQPQRPVSELTILQRFQEHRHRFMEASTPPFRPTSNQPGSAVDPTPIATTAGQLV